MVTLTVLFRTGQKEEFELSDIEDIEMLGSNDLLVIHTAEEIIGLHWSAIERLVMGAKNE